MKKRLVSILAICAMLTAPAAALADYEAEEAPAAETVTDTARADRQAEHEMMLERAKEQADIQKVIASEENGDIQLMAADTVTLSGTVTLPQGVTAEKGDSVYIVVYTIDKNSDGKILNMLSNRGTSADFTEGATSVDYSMQVPKGDYIVGMNTYSISSPAVLDGYLYYTSSGDYAYDERLGEVLTLNANKTVNFVLPAPKHTISGTVSLPEAAAEDTVVNMNAYVHNDNYRYSIDTSGSVTIKKGQTSVDYTMGLYDDGIYYIEMNNDTGYGYYSVYGDVRDYDDRMYFDTSKGNMTDMDVLFNPVPYDDTEEDEDTSTIPVTITLPEESKNYGGYNVEIERAYGSYAYGYANITIKPGQKTATANLPINYYIDEPTDFVVMIDDYYHDITMYYTVDGGVTTNYDKARVFNTSSIDQIRSLNIRIPKMSTVTGTVSRNGFMEGEYANLRLSGTTDDGETYDTTVIIPAGSDTASYTMLIPEKYIDSEFSMQTGLNVRGYAGRIVGDFVKLKFTGGTASEIVNAPDSGEIYKIKGKVVLPEAAPNGGVALEITGNYYYTANSYIIPEGETEANIDTYMAVEDPTDVDLEIYATAIDGETFAEYSDVIDITSENIDITMEKLLEGEEVTVSGKVKLPQDVTLTNGLSYEVDVSTDYGSHRTYNSIFKNESEASYSVKIPKGCRINKIELTVNAAGGSSIYDQTIYYTPEGTVTDENNGWMGMNADDDKTDIDLALMRGLMISGTIKTPDGAPLPKNARIHVYAARAGWRSSIASCTIDGVTQNEIPYSLVLSPDFTGDVNIYYYVSDESRTYNSEDYYYSSNGPVISSDDADVITVNGADITGKDLVLVKNKAAVTLSAQTAYGIPANVDIYLTIGLESEGYESSNAWISIYDGETKSDEGFIEVPDIAETADMTSFKLYYESNSYDSDDYNCDYVYINPDGTCTQYTEDAKEFDMGNKNVTFTVYPSSYYAAEAAGKGDLEITDANATRTEDGLDLEVSYEYTAPLDNYNVAAIVCAYDNNNRLLGAACGNLELLSYSDTAYIDILTDLTGDKYRLYLWDNTHSITPLCAPFELTGLDTELG